MHLRHLVVASLVTVAPVALLGLPPASALGQTASALPVPTGLQDGRVACAGSPAYVSTPSPTLTAQTTDPVDHQPTLEFDVTDPSGVHVRQQVSSGGDGQPAEWTVSLAGDGTYAWRVRGVVGSGDTVRYSPWSATQRFVLDTSAPATPVSTSYDYPPDLWGGPVGRTITSGSTSGTPAGYAFGWDITPPDLALDTCVYEPAPGARTGLQTSASFTVPTDLPAGRHTLWTRAFDSAHNASATTSYVFYVSRSITSGGPVLPTRLEGEGLSLTPHSSAATYAESLPWASAGGQLHIVPAAGGANPVGQSVTTTVVAGIEGDYALSALMTTGPFYGQVTFALDGQPTGPAVFDGYDPASPSASTQRWVDLGGRHLSRGTHRLTVTLSGHTATHHVDPVTGRDDQGYAVGLDLLTVAPVSRFTAASFADALNDHGIVTRDGATDPANGSTDLGQTPERTNLSLRALRRSDAGVNRTTPVTLDGVPFQLATPRGADRGWADNVVAIGQTIPIGPEPRVLSSVDLLVAAACGDVAPPPSATNPNPVLAKFGLTHLSTRDTVTATPTVPTVSDLRTPASTTATHVTYGPPDSTTAAYVVSGWQTPYADLGTTPSAATRPWIYHVRIPVNPNYLTLPVTSLTLPDLGTTFTPGSCRPSLHVLAMTPVP